MPVSGFILQCHRDRTAQTSGDPATSASPCGPIACVRVDSCVLLAHNGHEVNHLSGDETMKSSSQILQMLQAMKPELEAGYHVKSIGIFGSVLRGEAHGESDIDVLGEFQPPIGLFRFLELEELLSERLGGRVDLVSRKALKPAIGQAILGEAVLA